MVRVFGRPAVAVAAACLLLGPGAAGCSDTGNPRTPLEPFDGVVPPPAPATTPANLLRRLEWSYDHRSFDVYGGLFTGDFQVSCGPFDSAMTVWTRGDEIGFARNLFQGGGPDQPAAVSIALRLDTNFYVLPDPEFTAWDPLGRWHKSIRTSGNLQATLADQSSVEINGYLRFFVVRGDSAMIPEELVQGGARPDSTRWYIRRWDDDTGLPIPAAARAPLHSQPTRYLTWCALKRLYR